MILKHLHLYFLNTVLYSIEVSLFEITMIFTIQNILLIKIDASSVGQKR